jgi:hypothetical protein
VRVGKSAASLMEMRIVVTSDKLSSFREQNAEVQFYEDSRSLAAGKRCPSMPSLYLGRKLCVTNCRIAEPG